MGESGIPASYGLLGCPSLPAYLTVQTNAREAKNVGTNTHGGITKPCCMAGNEGFLTPTPSKQMMHTSQAQESTCSKEACILSASGCDLPGDQVIGECSDQPPASGCIPHDALREGICRFMVGLIQ